jgi:hypothetical protein
MKSGRWKWFSALLCVSVFVTPKMVRAVPTLDLWMTGELAGTDITIEVHRTNTDFGLAGLSYSLQFSESLWLSREYSNYGWIANDGLFDNSNPLDGAAAVSLTTATFDTVASPAGAEFAADTSGIVELLTFSDVTLMQERWIYFDVLTPQASNGAGNDLETTLQGSINVTSFAVYVPEPTTLVLIGVGGLTLLRKHRK